MLKRNLFFSTLLTVGSEKKKSKVLLPDQESNPGLPRDRRRSSPLDYRGLLCVPGQGPYHFPMVRDRVAFLSTCLACFMQCLALQALCMTAWNVSRSQKKSYSFEPDLNQRPMDYCYDSQLQSTALPTELSKVS